MNIAETFIRRPVMTTLSSLAIVLFGLMAYRYLPVNDLPNVDFPTIVVSASLPGASPETMASSVATPLEKQFSTIAGLDSMTSNNIQGSTNITLQFNLTRNIDAGAQDVQAAIAETQAELPLGMPSPPSYRKVNPADQPILYLGLSSTHDADFAGRRVRRDLPRRAHLDGQRRRAGAGLRIAKVRGADSARSQGARHARHRHRRGLDRDPERQRRYADRHALRPSPGVHRPDQGAVDQRGGVSPADRHLSKRFAGAARRCRAACSTACENDKTAGWTNGEPSVVLAIQRQPGDNTVEVVDNVLRLLPAFQAEVPAGLHISKLGDRADTIRASVNDVQFTLLLTVFLVVMVIFLFLRNLSATIIPSLALPMSIIGTFAVMWVLNYTLDNLSLMAITLASASWSTTRS